jgi:hypothetical protein
MSRQSIIAIALTVIAVNGVAALMMGASRASAPEAVYVPEYGSTLQLVSVADRPASGLPADTAADLQPADDAPPPAPQAAVAPLVDTPEPVQAQCWRIGPFSGAEGLAEASARLESRGVTVLGTPESTVTVRTDHLVYLGPFASRKKARSVRDALQKDGLEASVIRSGARVNAVSIGVFRKAAYARRQAQRAQELGYKVQDGKVPQLKKVSHILARTSSEDALVLAGVESAASRCDEPAIAIASAN